MNAIQILKLVGKVNSSNDGGMSIVAEIIKEKGYKAITFQLTPDGNSCTSQGYRHEVIKDYATKKELIAEIAEDYKNVLAENLLLKSKLTSHNITY